MRSFKLSVFIIMMILSYLMSGCGTYVDKSSINGIDNLKGKTYYTNFTIYALNGMHKTTNYRYGSILPINSAVQIIDFTIGADPTSDQEGQNLVIRNLATGEDILIFNVPSYSGVLNDEYFRRFLSEEPTDLSMVSANFVEKINQGIVTVGMSKNEVLMALGYPPAHQTPSLDKNTWRYWKDKYTTFVISFNDNGQLATAVGAPFNLN